MAAGPAFTAHYDALPILGIDGTEWMSLPSSSPALGKIVAKSGTTITGDLLNQQYLLLGKASAGYLTARSGRELVWAVYVNDVLSADLFDRIGVGADAIYEANERQPGTEFAVARAATAQTCHPEARRISAAWRGGSRDPRCFARGLSMTPAWQGAVVHDRMWISRT
jgi:hypothetical protein